MLKLFRKKPQKTVINSLSNINGLVREGNDYLSDKVIFLDQKLAGNLFCSEEIFIENDGELQGNICGKHCVISGTVTGNISTTELLEITKTAVIRGKIRATDICIEPGAVVNGAITIGEDKAAATTLSNRIKKHTPEEYAELRSLDEHSKDEALNKPTTATVEGKKEAILPPPAPVAKPEVMPSTPEPEKPKQKEVAAPIKEEQPLKAAVPPVPPAEQIIREEPDTKLPPPRKAPEPKKDDSIQRWW
jgi:cytoskeletal protein CcmA (bactofilin family)